MLTEVQTQDMHKAWLWLTKGTEVVTNRHGPETHWEVITGQSPNEDHDYIAHDGLLAGGNIIKITGEKIRKGGQVLYPSSRWMVRSLSLMLTKLTLKRVLTFSSVRPSTASNNSMTEPTA